MKRIRALRVGILGGTFNPIHAAHLRCAEEAREALDLDQVLFIPSASPPHKRSDLATARHRLAMVRLAVRGNPCFRASAIEIERDGFSYSVDTLELLRQRAEPRTQFVFLLGIDAFREIHSWKEYLRLFSLTDVAVLSRPPQPTTDLLSVLPVAARREFCYLPGHIGVRHTSGHRITTLQVTELDISASDIRRRLRSGRSIRYLVPAAVETYIARHRLYQRESRER